MVWFRHLLILGCPCTSNFMYKFLKEGDNIQMLAVLLNETIHLCKTFAPAPGTNQALDKCFPVPSFDRNGRKSLWSAYCVLGDVLIPFDLCSLNKPALWYEHIDKLENTINRRVCWGDTHMHTCTETKTSPECMCFPSCIAVPCLGKLVSGRGVFVRKWNCETELQWMGAVLHI